MKINSSIGTVIASDTQSTIKSVDAALAQQSRMCADLADACLDSNVPMNATQPVFESLGKSLMGMIESRAHLSVATRDLIRIQSKSNLKETSFGCPEGWVDIPPKKKFSGQASEVDIT